MFESTRFKGGEGHNKKVLVKIWEPQFDTIRVELNLMMGNQWNLKISFYWQLQGELIVQTLNSLLW